MKTFNQMKKPIQVFILVPAVVLLGQFALLAGQVLHGSVIR